MRGARGVQKTNARVTVPRDSVVGLLHHARHRRTHHVASTLAGTGAPSTNNHEIDVFCCSVDGPTRPVSCHITPCWTWNQSDVEEKCQCASLSSVRTTLKTVKEVTHHHMLLKQAQLKTTPKGNGVALEYDNMFEAREQLCPEHECVTESDKCECAFTTSVGLHSPPVIDGGRTHRVARNMAGTSAPSTKNFFRDVSCSNSRVAVTRLLRMLRRQPMRHSAKKPCASNAQKHETQTNADVCANLSSFTQLSMQENCILCCQISSFLSENC